MPHVTLLRPSFHAHGDAQGDGVAGMDPMEPSVGALPELGRIRMVMPVSLMATPLPGCHWRHERLVPEGDPAERILLLPQPEFESAESVAAGHAGKSKAPATRPPSSVTVLNRRIDGFSRSGTVPGPKAVLVAQYSRPRTRANSRGF